MVIPAETKLYTPEEYLELEEKAEFKHEYRDGQIIPMTGGTTNHNEVAGSFYSYLRLALRKKDYRIYIGDVKLWIPHYRQYTYPDLMVISGEPVYAGKGETTVMNPCLIAEILSQSTRNYDQGEKFKYYRSIPELREYILIEPTQFYVLQYVKNEAGQWVLTEYTGQDNQLQLNTVEFELSFRELYEGVNFS
ncbi:Uma2 family endonuclease [Spirulina sp. CS-785/01]|uniref:Uma2 family endonuclease n=1 Tax=Spirulina sp. CS-785/01 TaxID=3021716 RepID=UPI00232DFF8E|nr:Uma2 family endonuclease [Spirulina sp. CS-785/01]MDB9311683.1 Uma2 family endonuclease [Spirulina sp. CS-785/01]